VVLADARGIPIPGLPAFDALQPALAGTATTRELSIEGQPVRVYTEPVYVDGTIAGAVQVAQGQGEYEAALRVVRLATLGGLLLGAAVAIPAGLFLASRSMRPIRQAFDQQRAFVADASHELRTPLTVLRAQTEYLQRSPQLTDAERSAGYQAIVDEVDAMSLLVNDLLLLARADSASMTLERGPNDLAAIARHAATSFAEHAREGNVTLSVDAPQPVVAQVDADRMAQVIRILLDNAIMHTPAGGSVTVLVDQQAGKPRLSVIDTGTGIASDELDRIFDRFYRGTKARAANSGGLGLGLAIAKTLVEAHGASINAASQPGAGSTFTITFQS
jgi:two-component system sensor histidine kinase CiaH